MKLAIRFTLFCVGILFALLALNGCLIDLGSGVTPAPGNQLMVMVTPDSGHPPFEVTITAQDKGGGTYTFEPTGQAAVTSEDRSYETVVNEWPWECAVTWTDGDSVAKATVRVALVNEPPTIRQPWMAGSYGVPFWRTLLDFRFHGASCGSPAKGITDPEGDDWEVTSITIQCEYNDEPDTLFYPSIFGIKEFYVDASSECNTIEVYPAAIWYPGYVAEIQSGSGLPFSISKKDGKSVDGDRGYPVLNPFVSPLFRAQDATITVTAEDSFGASSTESFIIHIIAYTG